MKIWMVIANNGDGSNSIRWVKDAKALNRMRELADEGEEAYGSGDGLQDTQLIFPSEFDVEAWVTQNHLRWTTLDGLSENYD